MPETLVLHPLAMRPQPGVNLDLLGSCDWALANDMSISLWGPYEICPELYYKACRRYAYLERGGPQYNVVDRNRRPVVLDCIHAVSGVDHDPGRLHTRLAYGEIASFHVHEHLSRFLIHPEITHDWIGDCLGIWSYPIQRRAAGEKPFSMLPILPPRYTPQTAPLTQPRFRLEPGELTD